MTAQEIESWDGAGDSDPNTVGDAPTIADVHALVLAQTELLARYVKVVEGFAEEVGPILEKLQNSPIMKFFK